MNLLFQFKWISECEFFLLGVLVDFSLLWLLLKTRLSIICKWLINVESSFIKISFLQGVGLKKIFLSLSFVGFLFLDFINNYFRLSLIPRSLFFWGLLSSFFRFLYFVFNWAYEISIFNMRNICHVCGMRQH